MDKDFSQYRELVAEQAAKALTTAQDPLAMADDALAHARPAAQLLLRDDASLHQTLAEGFRRLAELAKRSSSGSAPRLSDGSGQKRQTYHLLSLHLHLAAFLRRYENVPLSVWSACEDALEAAIAPARAAEQFAGAAPPSRDTAEVLWQTLCIAEAARAINREADLEMIDSIVHEIVAVRGTDGSLTPEDPDQALEIWTYNELCGLHALANLALQRRNQTWARRVKEVASYHVQHTQPDYTTYQPWANFAFAWDGSTRSFAVQQLHDVSSQAAASGDANMLVAGLLLADAFDAAAQFGA